MLSARRARTSLNGATWVLSGMKSTMNVALSCNCAGMAMRSRGSSRGGRIPKIQSARPRPRRAPPRRRTDRCATRSRPGCRAAALHATTRGSRGSARTKSARPSVSAADDRGRCREPATGRRRGQECRLGWAGIGVRRELVEKSGSGAVSRNSMVPAASPVWIPSASVHVVGLRAQRELPMRPEK